MWNPMDQTENELQKLFVVLESQLWTGGNLAPTLLNLYSEMGIKDNTWQLQKNIMIFIFNVFFWRYFTKGYS